MATEDDEIFEIQDFTTTTEWEKFTARLETLIHEWQLTGKSDPGLLDKGSLRGAWKVQQEPVKLSGVHFKLFHYKLEQVRRKPKQTDQSASSSSNSDHVPAVINDMLNPGNEFAPFYEGPSQIARWFGLPEFLFLSPASRTDIIFNDSKLNLILSSLSMATLGTACELPFFTSYDDMGRHLYFGICQNHNVRTNFTTIHLNSTTCDNLAGILDLFKEKVACPISTPPPVKVSIRLIYRLAEKLDSDMVFPNIEDFDTPPKISKMSPKEFPFGVGSDPLRSLDLCVVWPSMNEDMVVENDVYTDLDPNGAPHWSLSVAFMGGLECLMHDSLKKFLENSRYHTGVKAELGIVEQEPEVGSALGRLTKAPVHNILPTSGSASDFRRLKAPRRLPLDENTLDSLIEFVFGIASDQSDFFTMRPTLPSESGEVASLSEKSSLPGKVVSSQSARKNSLKEETGAEFSSFRVLIDKLKVKLTRAKSSPSDSVAFRLSLALRVVNDSAQGRAGLCHLWYEFVDRLRNYWDSGTLIPGIDESGEPDVGSCLLHQKLVMLQSCLVAKQKREGGRQMMDYQSDETDEFFDCMEDKADEESTPTEPEGRLEPLAICYLDDSSKVLYKPETQESGPMTEDMLAEEVNRMMEMGTTQEGAEIRAKMQSQSLISDIQAFKAANPGARFEDFVRWHSPRDWIEEDETGQLSHRMSFPDNLWVQLWAETSPLPVFRQKRLFDYAKCGEKILSWLESSSISGVVMLTIPSLFSSALSRLYDESSEVHNMIEGKLFASCSKLTSASHQNNPDMYRDILNDVAWVENTVAQFRALKTRFWKEYLSEGGGGKSKSETQDLDNLIAAAMLEREVPLIGAGAGLMGRMLRNVFANNANEAGDGATKSPVFPNPMRKEYIVKWRVPRPLSYSRPTPQRLYASVGPAREFRVAGAFTDDALFF